MINLGKENENVEYKNNTDEISDAMKSISAMLNKSGKGTIYFGVKNIILNKNGVTDVFL